MRINKNAPDSSSKTVKGYDLLLPAEGSKTI
jgi:hypothetical protein